MIFLGRYREKCLSLSAQIKIYHNKFIATMKTKATIKQSLFSRRVTQLKM